LPPLNGENDNSRSIAVNELEVAEQRAGWNGRHVVIGMFLFGITMVAAMWLYWELYTRPFRALQNAIHAEFPTPPRG
jgi:hypothetical protein